MKRILSILLVASLFFSLGCFTTKDDPEDIQKAQHFTALFYDQVMAGNRAAAVDTFFLSVINATGKKALNALHSQYGALHQIKFNKTNTLVRRTDEDDIIAYKVIVSETYKKKTILSKVIIDNQSGKLKISGFEGNYDPKKDEDKEMWETIGAAGAATTIPRKMP